MFDSSSNILARYAPYVPPQAYALMTDAGDYYGEACSKHSPLNSTPALPATAVDNPVCNGDVAVFFECPECLTIGATVGTIATRASRKAQQQSHLSFETRHALLQHLHSEHRDKCPYCNKSAMPDRLSWQCHLVNHTLCAPQAKDEEEKEHPKPVDKSDHLVPIESPVLEPFGLDAAILECLSRVPPGPSNIDVQARLSRLRGNVLVCGGAANCINRFVPFLMATLNAHQQSSMAAADGAGQEMSNPIFNPVLTTKDLDGRFVSWKGASFLARLDASITGEQWVGRGEWREMGERVFKERLSFPLP